MSHAVRRPSRVSPVEHLQRVTWGALSSLRRSERLWSLLDATGIVVFVGPNGSGKSLAAIASTLNTLRGIDWTCDQLAHHHAAPLARHIDQCGATRNPRPAAGSLRPEAGAERRGFLEAEHDHPTAELPVAIDQADDDDRCDRGTSTWDHLCPVGRALAAEHCQGTRLVYSTVPILDDDGEPHDLYRPLVDFRQLVGIEHADVLFDEVAGVSDASDSSGVPVQVTNWLHQLRKRDVRLRVTTPAYARCSKPIRQVAQVVVDARSFFPERSATGRLWRPRRAMLFTAYDAFAFADYTASTGERLPSLAGAAFWRPGSEASRRYDTLGAVNALGHVTEGGMCAVCGGARSRPKCGCPAHVDDVPMELLQVEEVVSASGARTRRARVLDTIDQADEDDAAA